jgi:hypothetical protein
MRDIRWWCTVFVCFLMLMTVRLNAQVTIENPANSGISVSLYDATKNPAFAKLFEDRELAKLLPYSVVLTNLSKNAVVGLTLRWTLTDRSGQMQIYDRRTDSFFLVRTPILQAGSNALVAGDLLLPESLATSGFVATRSADADRFADKAHVTLSIDTVIFEGGEIRGPDASRSVAYIQARKTAADTVVNTMRRAIAEGETFATLSQLAAQRPSSPDNYIDLWTYRIAKDLQRSKDVQRSLDQLAGLPSPSFHRNQ